MKIMSKRQRKWYDKGWTDGKTNAEASTAALEACTAALEARNKHWQVQWNEQKLVALRDEKDHLDGRIRDLQRELQFALDRVEQLQNSVVIIRDGKK